MTQAFTPDQSSFRLLSDELRIPVERLVSQHYGSPWQVASFTDLNDRACHPAGILSDGTRRVFVKLSAAAHGRHQFDLELAGLQLISKRAGVPTPTPIAILSVDGGTILVLEAVQEVERTSREWREIGRTLARIHSVKGSTFGLETQGYFGPLFQDNRPIPQWPDFFLERRLWPRLVGAIDSGFVPTDIIRQIERIMARLPRLDVPESQPSLLHGDAQQNNFVSTPTGALVIDPAVYYGIPEMDLAFVDYFQPVPRDVFDAYRELLPVDPGFEARRALWRIPAYLAAVQVEGAAHLGKLVSALQAYA